jgi:hypothetical protein
MRLTKAEVPKRLAVKLTKSIKAGNKEDLPSGAMYYGDGNDYPQLIENIILSSPTGKLTAGIYASFLTGGGFVEDVNNEIIGKDSQGRDMTVLSLLRQVSKSFAYFNGAYVHTNKNLNNEVVNSRFIPFKFCRFNKTDDLGYCSQILVWNNWDADVNLKSPKENIKAYDIFTNSIENFTTQVKAVKGGINNYNGQIYFGFADNTYLYPLSPFDSVYLDCDTENQVSLFKNREIRNGFMGRTAITLEAIGDDKAEEAMEQKVIDQLGADGDRVLVMWDKVGEDGNLVSSSKRVIDSIPSQINDKLFENWEQSLSNNIRKALKLPALLIDYEQGTLSGTSGEAIIQATTYYNSITQDDRAFISQMFAEIFKNSANQKLKTVQNWLINPLNIYQNANSNV